MDVKNDMSFPFILIDSDVLIHCLRSGTKVVFYDFLKNFLQQGEHLAITHINIFEILSGTRPQEMKLNRLFLGQLPVVPADSSSVELAAQWYRIYRKKGFTLSLADLFIAGLAKTHDSALLTQNIKDFPMLKTKNEYRLGGISVFLLS